MVLAKCLKLSKSMSNNYKITRMEPAHIMPIMSRTSFSSLDLCSYLSISKTQSLSSLRKISRESANNSLMEYRKGILTCLVKINQGTHMEQSLFKIYPRQEMIILKWIQTFQININWISNKTQMINLIRDFSYLNKKVPKENILWAKLQIQLLVSISKLIYKI